MKKVMFVGAALLMAACARSSTDPSGARRSAPAVRSNDEISCKGGYVIAYDEDGNAYCAPDPGFVPGDSVEMMSSRPTPQRSSPRQ